MAPEAAAHAYPVLDEAMARVGVDGLVAALAQPALLALVDQHAAAVRESLRGAGRPVDADAVSGYARSVMASAERMGRRLPEPGEADLGLRVAAGRLAPAAPARRLRDRGGRRLAVARP